MHSFNQNPSEYQVSGLKLPLHLFYVGYSDGPLDMLVMNRWSSLILPTGNYLAALPSENMLL